MYCCCCSFCLRASISSGVTKHPNNREKGAEASRCVCNARSRFELFNEWGGRGCDDSVPGKVTKTAPSGDRTKWSPTTWSASLPQMQLIPPGGWSNMSPVGAIFVPSPPKTGTDLLHPRHPPIVERVISGSIPTSSLSMVGRKLAGCERERQRHH